MKGKRIPVMLLLLCVLLFLSSCGRQEIPAEGETYIYYLNGDMAGLVRGTYTIGDGDTEKEALKMLEALQKEPEDIERHSVFPEGVRVKEIHLTAERILIDLSPEYEQEEITQQALIRAAVVQSLVQLDGVDAVGFTVNGEPLRDTNGKAVGYLNADDFVQNTGSTLHSYQNAELELYFANEAGDGLMKETVDVKYSSNMPLEKLIVEQIIKGPSHIGNYPTVNPETKVLGVTSKEGICYVNLDDSFLNNTCDVVPEVAVYSLVNSIIQGTDVRMVQILINGETNVSYMDAIDLSKPFKLNEILLEQSE